MELLKVFDSQYTYMKNENRDTVHTKGYWHETFHCWILDEQFVYIQKRSAQKKDFPGCFDISAAGHLLAHESVADGLREVEEELGLRVDLSRLQCKGVIRDVIEIGEFLDREFANIYLYHSSFSASDFSLQPGEVDSIHTVERETLAQLFVGERNQVTAVSLVDGSSDEIQLTDFVPHEKGYFERIGELLKI
ncbi:NUDIX domain-containing protein [Sporosarcina sp. 179-K 3D1 HS]|uniref:NUDIX hydrolase n=1 Tax=Sporosarcina sp. 179-K 3D1 HS TaxID=3232169 RepID=UPI0039A36158